MQTMLRSKITLLFMMLGLLVAVPTVAFAAQTFTLSVPVPLEGTQSRALEEPSTSLSSFGEPPPRTIANAPCPSRK